MKLLCIESIGGRITKGVVYKLIEETTEFYYVMDNWAGKSGWLKCRFIICKQCINLPKED